MKFFEDDVLRLRALIGPPGMDAVPEARNTQPAQEREKLVPRLWRDGILDGHLHRSARPFVGGEGNLSWFSFEPSDNRP